MTKLFAPRAHVLRQWERTVATTADANDVYILTSSGRRIPAHSNILASMSPVLENKLRLPAKQGESEKVIPILGVPSDAVLAFLRLLYAGWYGEGEGSGKLIEKYGMQLLVLSHVYQVLWLKRACEGRLAASLRAEAVADVLAVSRRCDASRLSQRCLKLASMDFAVVEKAEGWLFLQANDPCLELDVLQFLHHDDLRKKMSRKIKKEQNAYLQLGEAMECLLHICAEGCTDVGPAGRRRRLRRCPSLAACQPLQFLLLHFAKCDGDRSACHRCRRIWQLLKLHSAVCMARDSSDCKVPLCRQFRLRMERMEGKTEERKWRLLGKKVAAVMAFSKWAKRKRLECGPD